jgi:hypothetical protein
MNTVTEELVWARLAERLVEIDHATASRMRPTGRWRRVARRADSRHDRRLTLVA